jgi:di/tricarboxylate transporter
VLALGIVYMLFARRWLAAKDERRTGAAGRPRLRDWIETYGLADREHRVRVTARSPLVGRTLEELRLRDTSGANIPAIERQARFAADIVRPVGKTVLRAGDVLLVDLFAPDADICALRQDLALEPLPLTGRYFADLSQQIGMVEVMLPEGSWLIGKTLVRSGFRTRYDLTAVGLRRGRAVTGHGFRDEELRIGDTLLLVGFWRDNAKLQAERADLLVLDLPAELDEVLPAASRAPQALLCLALVVGLMVSGVVPNVHAALIGCLLMGACAASISPAPTARSTGPAWC